MNNYFTFFFGILFYFRNYEIVVYKKNYLTPLENSLKHSCLVTEQKLFDTCYNKINIFQEIKQTI